MLNISQVLSEVEAKGGKEDLEVEVSQKVPQNEFEGMREKLLVLGFKPNKKEEGGEPGNGPERRRFLLEKTAFSESALKEMVNSEKSQGSSNSTPTSKQQVPGIKGKKENYMDKSQRLEEELAEIRAEKARKFKDSTGKSSQNKGGDNGSSGSYSTGGGGNGGVLQEPSSSLRRFMNFNWFTSMFSSRRRNTSQRDRMYLDSSYYRSKNTGCCGSGCRG